MQEFLMSISREFGTSAHEEKIRKLIEDKIKNNVDDIVVDNLGNLIAFKKGKIDKERIMISVPMDQICFIVTHIEGQTKYRFSMLSNVDADLLVNASVLFENGVKGTILKEEGIEDNDLDVSNLYIATSAEDEKRYGAIKLGKVCVLDGEYLKDSDYIKGVALYPRAGCSIVKNIIKSVPEVKNDVYFVFSVHGMLNARGAIVATHSVHPTVAICIGAIPLKDKTKLGKGPVLVIRDNGTISHTEIISSLEKIAQNTNILIQRAVSKDMHSDSLGILKAGCNCKVANISYPIRNIYTNCEVICKEDLVQIERLVINYIK